MVFLIGISGLLYSCEDLTELNINPNGVSEEEANVNLILSNVLTNTGTTYNILNFDELGGVVQHTQLVGWHQTFNDYSWANSSIRNWNGYYAILRDNELLRKRAIALDLDFHHGVSLVIRAFIFGLITDMWGDAPYSDALQAESGEEKHRFPKFDEQQHIYEGILEELKQANELLSSADGSYRSVVPEADVFLNGKASSWRRFANSLALRYYMRVSDKLPEFSRAGIENIMSQPGSFPVITTASQDVNMAFVGNNSGDSWPSNTVFDASGRDFRIKKMASTLVDRLQLLKDPRLEVWANKIEIPIRVDAGQPAGTDRMEQGIRIVSPDIIAGIQVDQDLEYVGIPPSVATNPNEYNLNPVPTQEGYNVHVSYLNDIYKAAKGELLLARLMTAAEVYFILAEAAWKGWNVGNTAQYYYEQGIRSSLESWKKADQFETYVQQEQVQYNQELSRIIEQKWIASWTMSSQAWFDYRRTGLPALKAGPVALRTQLPLRLPYPENELSVNQKNSAEAIERLEVTLHSQADGKNSAWSKSWLQQGSSKPW